MSISIIYLKSGDRRVKGDIGLPIKTRIKLKALLSSHLMIHIVFILLISDSTVVHIIIINFMVHRLFTILPAEW